MPELPEVALFARDLASCSRGKRLLRVTYPNRKDWGQTIIPSQIRRTINTLVGNEITFFSNGKALYLKAYDAKSPIVEFRLGMTGQFHSNPAQVAKRHCFLKIELEGETIFYSDPRRFGRVRHPTRCEYSLGGYILGAGLKKFRITRVPPGSLTKPRVTWLLSTGHLTGVGNYLANEALGVLDLSPFLPCKNEREARKILEISFAIAKESYALGGNSFATGYYTLNGTEGLFATSCRFYQNPGIIRQMFQGRPVFSRFQKSSKKKQP